MSTANDNRVVFFEIARCVCGGGLDQDSFCLTDGAACCSTCYMFANQQLADEEDAARLGYDLTVGVIPNVIAPEDK